MEGSNFNLFRVNGEESNSFIFSIKTDRSNAYRYYSASIDEERNVVIKRIRNIAKLFNDCGTEISEVQLGTPDYETFIETLEHYVKEEKAAFDLKRSERIVNKTLSLPMSSAKHTIYTVSPNFHFKIGLKDLDYMEDNVSNAKRHY